MPKFYKKGPLGMTKADGGMSDPELAEVRMTPKEYWDLYEQIQTAQKDAENARENASTQISSIRKMAQSEIEKATKKAIADANRKSNDAMIAVRKSAQETDSLREELEAAGKVIENEKNLNSNLQRIMRERSNQARGITPKKQHDGYLVLKSRQWAETYPVEIWDTEDHQTRYGGNKKLAMKKGYLTIEKRSDVVCRSTLQTPYDATIPLDLIQGRVLREDLWNGGILMELGCSSMCGAAVTGRYRPSEMEREKNVLYRWIFEANYKTGLWEMDLFTTKALTVPEHRWPPQKFRKIKEKSRKQVEPKAECVKNTNTRRYVPEDGEENLFTGIDLEVVNDLDEGDEENYFEDFFDDIEEKRNRIVEGKR